MTEQSFVYPRIDTARSIVRGERGIIDREIEAFSTFRTRLSQLETTANGGVLAASSSTQLAPARGVPPQRIVQAYRNSVLAMNHYAAEYDEPLVVHVEEEFNPEIRALFESSRLITPVQCRLLDRAVDEAIRRRRKMVRELSREDASLARVADRLGVIEGELIDLINPGGSHGLHREELLDIQQRCDELASRRQRTIHERPSASIAGIGARSLVAYLYSDHEHRFPALRAIADLAALVVEKLDN
ncbi:MAG: hypothetical protein ABEH59_02860 [Halobacteriales archaeon]